MHLTRIITTAILGALTMASSIDAGRTPGYGNPVSDKVISITHRTIASKRSFADSKAALEVAIPALNNTFRTFLSAGDTAGALAALQALPTLSNFILPPRDFGQLVTVQGQTGKKAVQYEIGNPYTASKFAKFDLGASVSACLS